MIRLFKVHGIPIGVHWTVVLIALIILSGNLGDLPLACAAGGSYLAVLALHELGHGLLARRLGYRVLSVSLYPLHGVCWHEDAGSEHRNAVIAWGGVLAQAVVAVPLLLYLALFGYTPFQEANAVIVILGVFSMVWAILNLVPIPPLDGAKAWAFFRRRRLAPPALPARRRDRRGLRGVR